MAHIINGKEVALSVKLGLKAEVASIKEESGVTPCLVVVMVGENPASKVYVRNKGRACEEAGIRSIQHTLPETATEELFKSYRQLNASEESTHTRTAPAKADKRGKVLEAIHPSKDVDGFHPPTWAAHDRQPDASAMHALRHNEADRIDRRRDLRKRGCYNQSKLSENPWQ